MSRNSRLRLVTGVAVLTVAAAACGSSGSSGGTNKNGSAATPGVTSTTVTIGSHQPLTGPAAPGYSEIAPASDAYFKYVNAHGGVNGRQIVFKYLDDGYNPATTVAKVTQLVQQDHVFAIFSGLGTPTHSQVLNFLNSNKVPDLFVASGCICWDQPSRYPETFGWQTDYVREGKILGKYLAAKFPGKKFAYFYQNDDFGTDGVKGLDMEIPKSHVVARQSYEPTNTNLKPQISAIVGKKPDVVVSFSIPAFTALLRLGFLQVNFSPALAVSNVGADPTTLTGLLSAFSKKGASTVAPLIQGVISDYYLPPTGDTSNSWIQLFKSVHDQYIPKLPWDGNVLYGMASAYTFVQVLKRAGRNLTRAGLVQAVEQGGLRGPGLTPFAFSHSSHAGFTGLQIATIQGGTLVLTGTPETTDDGSGPIKPYTQQQPQAPANGIPTD